MNFSKSGVVFFTLFFSLGFVGSPAIAQSELPASATPQFPAEFIATLPRSPVDRLVVLRQAIELAQNIDNGVERVHLLGSLQTVTEDKELASQLSRLIEASIDDCDEGYMPQLSHVVGHTPQLLEKMVRRAVAAEAKDKVRSGFAQHVDDFKLAKQICATIVSTDIRSDALNRIAYRAPSVAELLEVLEASLARRVGDDELYAYNSVYELRKYAAESPKPIRDFIARKVPTKVAISFLTSFAEAASESNPVAAKEYVDDAWLRVDETDEPYKYAPNLLSYGYRNPDRETWLAKFDKYVLTAILESKTGIDPLPDLARFDIELMIDRTKQIYLDARFDKILPSIMDRAFTRYPHAVLTWLEETDSPLKDDCIVKIVDLLELWNKDGFTDHEQLVDRLCDLALRIEEPRQRLTALAGLAAELPRLGVPVPDRVVKQGRVLLHEYVDFESIKLSRLDDEEIYFWLGTIEQRRRLFKTQLEKYRTEDDADKDYGLESLCDCIARAGLPCEEQIILLREVSEIAKRHANRALQTKVATSAVPCDAQWAVKTIWSILPDDRGRSGKHGNIGYVPPPDDANEAIVWLRQDWNEPDNEVKLAMALWNFLADTSVEDKDIIKQTICAALLDGNYFESALGVINTIEDAAKRCGSLVGLLNKLPKSF